MPAALLSYSEDDRSTLVDKIDKYLALDLKNIHPGEILQYLPDGWKPLGLAIEKFFTLYPDVVINRVFVQKGLLRMEVDLNFDDPVKSQLIHWFTNSVAKESSTICMVTGNQGSRATQIEEKPCLDLIRAAMYLTGLTERGRL